MSIVKLEPQGKLSLPQETLEQLGLYAVEIYNSDRIQEFLEGDLLSQEEAEKVEVKLAKAKDT